MREIKFRGKSDNDWVYGHLLKVDEWNQAEHEHFDYFIQTDDIEYEEYECLYITDNNTIGQYTGLKDKNGKEIYEGDIVELKAENGCCNMLGKIIYDDYDLAFELIDEEGNQEALWYTEQELEIIGNIYDNPELLKEEHK